jgi:two-component system chemotaxis sensor kinase CheA
MDEILGIFFEEVTGNIEELERLFLELGMDSDAAAFKTVFRIAHNIKGSSKSVGMANMGRVTHELETLLIKLGDGRIDLSPEILNVLLAGVDSLKGLLARAQECGSDDIFVEDVTDRIKSAQSLAEELKLAKQMNAAQDGDIIFINSDSPSKEQPRRSRRSPASSPSGGSASGRGATSGRGGFAGPSSCPGGVGSGASCCIRRYTPWQWCRC